MFSFSGCYHAFNKLKTDTTDNYFVSKSFSSSELRWDIANLQLLAKDPITGISIIKMNGTPYWQLVSPSANSNKEKDLMKDMSATSPVVQYINASYNSILLNGDTVYADYLVTKFSGHQKDEIRSTSLIAKFDDDYNFADKILPVWRVGYATNQNERYSVETATGKLSKKVNHRRLYEDYSFAFYTNMNFRRVRKNGKRCKHYVLGLCANCYGDHWFNSLFQIEKKECIEQV